MYCLVEEMTEAIPLPAILGHVAQNGRMAASENGPIFFDVERPYIISTKLYTDSRTK